ncbi:MAG: tetratricopeptide repeat protein [Methanosarcina sp.]|nr:tetratricopeptide repeat protein [Methanosarcina sp.]
MINTHCAALFPIAVEQVRGGFKTEAYSFKTKNSLKELQEHCRAAISAFAALEQSGSQASLRLCLGKFLSDCQGASMVLWRNNNRNLGKHLRSVFSVPGDSPLSPAAFSGLRAIIKEIEKEKGVKKENVDQGGPAAFFYNIEAKLLTSRGKNYEVLPIFLAVRDLYFSLPFFEELQTCTERLEKEPLDATALFQKAVLMYKASRFEAAEQLTAQVLKMVPDDHRVWYNRGVILSELGKLEEAIAAYNRTIELEPAFEVAWDNKGVVLARLGRFEEALETYEKVLLRSPEYAEAWAGKGSVLLALGREEKALEAYITSLQIRPDYLEALTSAGSLLSRLSRFKEALELYDKALQLAPTEPRLWAARGFVLSEMDQQEEALQNCNRALELKPGFVPALETKIKILSAISMQKARSSK